MIQLFDLEVTVRLKTKAVAIFVLKKTLKYDEINIKIEADSLKY